jgi:hypothetical protein
LCIKPLNVEELYRVFSNPSDNRPPFLHEMEQLLPFPSRFLVVEGTLQHRKAGGRLNQYHKIGLIDFLDALTVRYGIQIIYADTRDEAEERVANLAALHYAYYSILPSNRDSDAVLKKTIYNEALHFFTHFFQMHIAATPRK